VATTTTRLLLRKPDPDPSTGDFINVVTDINESMDKIDAAVGVTICTSGTRPTGADRWDGREIYETDTRRNYMWSTTLSTWIPLLIGRGGNGPYLLGPSTDTGGEGFNGQGTVAAAHMLRLRVGAEANLRFQLQADGQFGWGPGGGSGPDTFFGRTAANELGTSTGDALKVSGDYVCGSENGVNGQAVTSGSDTTSSTAFVNMAGTGSQTSFSFTKRFASTRVFVMISAGFFTGNGAIGPKFGVLINAVDYEICRQRGAITANAHLSVSGHRYITGIAAGTYTVQGRWAAVDAGAGLTRDIGDSLSISARECN
jgi:hypothetical protein